ncbi:MAG: hypothetical protein JW901_09825 [Dehalococcoidia bacterium]|nr:hypothetical protein [Dehalococcoidia bacterium]
MAKTYSASYEDMTISELEAAKAKLEVQKEEIRAEQKIIVSMINRKIAEKKLSDMTDAEKDAIKQVIGKS